MRRSGRPYLPGKVLDGLLQLLDSATHGVQFLERAARKACYGHTLPLAEREQVDLWLGRDGGCSDDDEGGGGARWRSARSGQEQSVAAARRQTRIRSISSRK